MAFQRIGFQNRGNGNPDDEGVSADVVRFAFWASTSGATGVGQAGDLRVTATATPSGSIYVQRGAAIIESAFTSSQSYAVMNDAAVQVAVPANNSASAVTWQVIVRVFDAQYPGEPDNTGIPSVLLVGSLPAGQTYIHLATITMPANTAIVAQSQIADRRDMVNPRRKTDNRMAYVGSEQPLAATVESGEQWPNEGLWTVAIPKWATKATITGIWSQYLIPKQTSASKTRCACWIEVGWGRSDMVHTDFFYIQTEPGSLPHREGLVLPGYVDIPSSMRGQSVRVMMKGRLLSGPWPYSPKMDTSGGAGIMMEFVEAPTQDI